MIFFDCPGFPPGQAAFGGPGLDFAVQCGVFYTPAAVSLFYYPNYVCVRLCYFETAKRTSGVGLGAEPPQTDFWGGWNPPDGLG